MLKTKDTLKCFFYRICNNEINICPPVNEGKHISRYDITVCRSCYESNWDGWDQVRGEILWEYLKANDISAPNPNYKGLLPRE